jgi:hypothetical protein
MIGQNPAIICMAQKIDQVIAKKIGFWQLQFFDESRNQVRDWSIWRNLHRLRPGQSAFFYINFEHERASSVTFTPPLEPPHFKSQYTMVTFPISHYWAKLAILCGLFAKRFSHHLLTRYIFCG